LHFRILAAQTKARLRARALMSIKIDLKILTSGNRQSAIGLLLKHFRPALAPTMSAITALGGMPRVSSGMKAVWAPAWMPDRRPQRLGSNG